MFDDLTRNRPASKITHFEGTHQFSDPGFWIFNATRHGAPVNVVVIATPFGFSLIVASALTDPLEKKAANDAMPDALNDGESHRLERLWALLTEHKVEPIITETGQLYAFGRLHQQLAGIERERERSRSEA
jgi:hypothetical protein